MTDASSSSRMPAVFIGHGSPMNALEDNRYTQSWRAFGQSITTPRTIVAVSAHWYIDHVTVTSANVPVLQLSLVASGNVVHNLRRIDRTTHETPQSANVALTG
jgi:aromatic ring-opening dioxygenase catalytic subunit (LigB family)